MQLFGEGQLRGCRWAVPEGSSPCGACGDCCGEL